MSGEVLVVGSDAAGVQAASELARAGLQVHLVEGAAFLGGGGARDVPSHEWRTRLLELTAHPRIEVLTNARVTRLQGEGRHFHAEVRQRPRYVDAATCTACGDCLAVCPVTVSDGGETRTAIRGHRDLVPNIFAIEKRGIPPCQAACPAGIRVQGYVALITQGRFAEALALIRRDLPFPGICGRVCHHPCETSCRRGEHDEPLAIEHLKRFVADWEQSEERGTRGEQPATSNQHVAIVGSGPAGLSAAYFLAGDGFRVTVFEALPVAGGMMAVGIPAYRLPRDVLRREIAAIEALGVEVRTNTPVTDVDTLFEQGFEAVFVAVGAHGSRKLGVEGEELAGVLHGVSFLRDVNLGQAATVGRRVVVVGGGNVAVDSAMTALRLGATEVTILYRRSRAEMPAYPWEVEEAEREGITLRFLAAPTRMVGDGQRVTGVECVAMQLGEPDDSGRRRPVPVPGSEFVVEADTVIVAIGQSVEAGRLGPVRGGRLEADPLTLATARPGVFAGGDAVSGPASVVEAVAAGRRAAESMARYLRGEDLAAGRTLGQPDTSTFDYHTPAEIAPRPRAEMPSRPVSERASGFAEIELGFDEAQAVAEAGRCLSCNVCSECLECARVCQPGAIEHGMDEQRYHLAVGAVIVADGEQGAELGEGDGVYRIAAGDVAGASAVAAQVVARLLGHPPAEAPLPPRLGPVGEGSVGVFVCRCGEHISEVVDVDAVVAQARRLPGVGHVEAVAFACGHEGAAAIERAVSEHGLGRVVLAACSCCALDQVCYSCTSQRIRCKGNLLISPARVPFEFVNVREQCAWPHADHPALATAQAVRMVAAAVGRARLPRLHRDGRAATTAWVDARRCRACGVCQAVCEAEAIAVRADEQGKRVSQVDAARCVGCGTCAAFCPSGAIVAGDGTDEQLVATLEAVLGP